MIQTVLTICVPGNPNPGFGQLTACGTVLKYNVNGFRCWIVTYCLVGVSLLSNANLTQLGLVYDLWISLFAAANIFGLCLTLVAYLKARWAPTHPDDCRWSSSIWYDLFMGVEHNPRITNHFDFKLFFNGRAGIMAWALINICFAVRQHSLSNYVSNSMILINVLQLGYILDFFWNEDWYLRTIDIAHDHFGFYLAWGDCVCLPWTYTLQAYYLVEHPIHLRSWTVVVISVLYASGYSIFRCANDQKNNFRKCAAEHKECLIWGRVARSIDCDYFVSTKTGYEIKQSKLLISGFWGWARHFNYCGDLLIALSFCMCCGTQHVIAYFYVIYMLVLLLCRIERDHTRLHKKYGAGWDRYCNVVKYKLLPYIY